MIGVAARMESEGLRSNMLLQVHDELIFEAPLEEVEQLRDLVVDVMPRALELAPRSVEFAVAFKVATKLGTNWGELE
jgi:DNA polymerase-1